MIRPHRIKQQRRPLPGQKANKTAFFRANPAPGRKAPAASPVKKFPVPASAGGTERPPQKKPVAVKPAPQKKNSPAVKPVAAKPTAKRGRLKKAAVAAAMAAGITVASWYSPILQDMAFRNIVKERNPAIYRAMKAYELKGMRDANAMSRIKEEYAGFRKSPKAYGAGAARAAKEKLSKEKFRAGTKARAFTKKVKEGLGISKPKPPPYDKGASPGAKAERDRLAGMAKAEKGKRKLKVPFLPLVAAGGAAAAGLGARALFRRRKKTAAIHPGAQREVAVGAADSGKMRAPKQRHSLKRAGNFLSAGLSGLAAAFGFGRKRGERKAPRTGKQRRWKRGRLPPMKPPVEQIKRNATALNAAMGEIETADARGDLRAQIIALDRYLHLGDARKSLLESTLAMDLGKKDRARLEQDLAEISEAIDEKNAILQRTVQGETTRLFGEEEKSMRRVSDAHSETEYAKGFGTRENHGNALREELAALRSHMEKLEESRKFAMSVGDGGRAEACKDAMKETGNVLDKAAMDLGLLEKGDAGLAESRDALDRAMKERGRAQSGGNPEAVRDAFEKELLFLNAHLKLLNGSRGASREEISGIEKRIQFVQERLAEAEIAPDEGVFELPGGGAEGVPKFDKEARATIADAVVLSAKPGVTAAELREMAGRVDKIRAGLKDEDGITARDMRLGEISAELNEKAAGLEQERVRREHGENLNAAEAETERFMGDIKERLGEMPADELPQERARLRDFLEENRESLPESDVQRLSALHGEMAEREGGELENRGHSLLGQIEYLRESELQEGAKGFLKDARGYLAEFPEGGLSPEISEAAAVLEAYLGEGDNSSGWRKLLSEGRTFRENVLGKEIRLSDALKDIADRYHYLKVADLDKGVPNAAREMLLKEMDDVRVLLIQARPPAIKSGLDGVRERNNELRERHNRGEAGEAEIRAHLKALEEFRNNPLGLESGSWRAGNFETGSSYFTEGDIELLADMRVFWEDELRGGEQGGEQGGDSFLDEFDSEGSKEASRMAEETRRGIGRIAGMQTEDAGRIKREIDRLAEESASAGERMDEVLAEVKGEEEGSATAVREPEKIEGEPVEEVVREAMEEGEEPQELKALRERRDSLLAREKIEGQSLWAFLGEVEDLGGMVAPETFDALLEKIPENERKSTLRRFGKLRGQE